MCNCNCDGHAKYDRMNEALDLQEELLEKRKEHLQKEMTIDPDVKARLIAHTLHEQMCLKIDKINLKILEWGGINENA